MIYAAELYYLQDQKDFPFQRAVLITAIAVAQWCTHFHAKLLAPAKKQISPIEKQGTLPDERAQKESFVSELVEWIFANSMVTDLFYLLLDNKPIPQANGVAKFDHHDDTCCWVLNLTENEFAFLQDAWRKNDLPANLFYPEHETVCVPYPGNGLRSKVLRLLGAQKCYTPMQWQTLVLGERTVR